MRRLAFLVLLCFVPVLAQAQSLNGRWDAVIQGKEGAIPFQFEIGGSPDKVEVTYFDGTAPVRASTGGEFKDNALTVDFASYATQMNATLDGGVLRGTVGNLPFEAKRAVAKKTSAAKAPDIDGVWEIPFDSNKGEKAWRLVVDQKQANVDATIYRIDGDTGTISGGFDGKAFNLSRFSGERANGLTITPQADGSLALVLISPSDRREFKAMRPAAARAAGYEAPTDSTRHTSVKDPSEVFAFSGVDLEGRPMSNTDAKFKGKVIVLNIMGSWCPNCHDEAPFLAELDKKYRDKGLEVVALDFEDAAELKELKRLKAFIKRYDMRFTVLVAGERKDVNDRLPQAVNLNAWPTTFFIGRDGRVHSVHVGFPSQGNKEFIDKARGEITATVEDLLAQKG